MTEESVNLSVFNFNLLTQKAHSLPLTGTPSILEGEFILLNLIFLRHSTEPNGRELESLIYFVSFIFHLLTKKTAASEKMRRGPLKAIET